MTTPENTSTVPEGATHYLPNPKGGPQMYYRLGTHKFPDGETKATLSYFSPDFQTWRGTNENNIQDYVATRLVPL